MTFGIVISEDYTGCFTIFSDLKNFIKQKVNEIKSKFQSSSVGNIMLFLHMHQHAANLCKFFVVYVSIWAPIQFNTSLYRSPFTVTVLPLLSSNQYGPSIPFFAFNAQRAVAFGPFKYLSSISSGLSSPQYTLLW